MARENLAQTPSVDRLAPAAALDLDVSRPGTRVSADGWLIGFVLLHIPLALLLRQWPILSTVHALATFGVGFWIGFVRQKEDPWPLWVTAYILGAEVLWRATGAADQIAWEQAKYATVVILLGSLLRHRQQVKLSAVPILYMILQVPALASHLGGGFRDFHQLGIQTLLGPLALMMCALYFSSTRIDSHALKLMVLSALGPIVGTATLGAWNVLFLGESIYFGASSNVLASGGFGPNQVSNTLSLGIVLCWLLLVQPRGQRLMPLFTIAAMVALAIPMLLTFSRGGTWVAAGVLAVTMPSALKNNPHRWRILLILIVLGVIFVEGVWPWLNEFTAGALTERITSTSTTNRWELFLSEIQVWLDHPIFGVGPGLAQRYVAEYYVPLNIQAHVEYSRLLAEHGILGMIALVLLIMGPIGNFLRADHPQTRLWILGAAAFAFLYMAQSSTRTLAPSFMYGLTWLSLAHGTPTEAASVESA